MERPETIRDWYERTTCRARRSLLWATLLTALAAVLFWSFAPSELSSRIQIFNGAITIPAAGGIWIAVFMFIWLIPMREVSFRSQESIERTELRIQQAIDEKLAPAIAVWQRVGLRFESEVVPEAMKMIAECRATGAVLAQKAESIEAKVRHVEAISRPGVEVIKRIAGQVEREILNNLLGNVQAACLGVQGMVAPPGAAPPDIERALAVIAKSRQRAAAPRMAIKAVAVAERSAP